jgi:trehalose 6-phosphate phosphatase
MHTKPSITLTAAAVTPGDLPAISARTALFLDFDGTLVDLASTPESVQVPPELVPLLSALQAQLGGALAIVSGRKLDDLDHFLAPLQLPTAAEHGACYRRQPATGGAAQPAAPVRLFVLPDFHALVPEVFALAASHPGLQLEVKSACLALHYRHAPELEGQAHQVMQQALAKLPDMALMAGKLVFEIKPAQVSKGQAIRDFMQHPPFAGRRCLFVGDDVTDEAGFLAVHALGGDSVKVGVGASAASSRITSPEAVRQWLNHSSDALEAELAPGAVTPASTLLHAVESSQA